MLATWKCVGGLRSLRQAAEGAVIVEAIRSVRRIGFRVVHYSIQSNHLHLIVEADSRDDMVSGMRSLGGRLAKRLNKLWQRTGKLFVERFHERILKSLRQVRNALRYVLNNHRKHGASSEANRPDHYSSGAHFDGWADYWRKPDVPRPNPCASPGSWKLQVGWKREYPLIAVSSIPG